MTREQFEQTILPLQDRIYRFAASMLSDLTAAKDVTQEVLLKLWKGREKLDDVENLEAWSIRITRNTCYDRLQSPKNQSVALESSTINLLAVASSSKVTQQRDLLDYVQSLAKELPALQQDVFRLRDLMGYNNKEIKDLLGLTDSQVKVNLCRARQKIKSGLIKRMNYGVTN